MAEAPWSPPCGIGDLVWVVWKDAVNQSARAIPEDLAAVGLATNTNLGWIVHRNSERIVLAHGVSGTREVDHFAIPYNCIIQEVVVRKSRKQTPKPSQAS